MQFINFLLFVFILPIMANADLLELKTKQALNKLRYISNDGKVTYYQKNSGELQMSTNYNFANILSLTTRTNYSVFASKDQKRVAIEASENYHSVLSPKENNLIYSTPLTSTEKAAFMGEGTAPRLHLEDQWLSYYDKRENKIIFKSFNPNIKGRHIKLIATPSYHFTPEVIMISPNDVIYTDINKEGEFGTFLYSFIEKKFQLIYKSNTSRKKVQICKIKSKLYIGEFPILNETLGAKISSVEIYGGKNFKEYSTIYSSQFPDIGNLLCDNDSLYFIKTTRTDEILNLRETEVAKLNLKTSKIEILTNLKYITQILKLNKKILTPFRGKILIVEGKNNLTRDAIISTKKEEEE